MYVSICCVVRLLIKDTLLGHEAVSRGGCDSGVSYWLIPVWMHIDSLTLQVRRHGVYVWGLDWEKAKTQAEVSLRDYQ